MFSSRAISRRKCNSSICTCKSGVCANTSDCAEDDVTYIRQMWSADLLCKRHLNVVRYLSILLVGILATFWFLGNSSVSAFSLKSNLYSPCRQTNKGHLFYEKNQFSKSIPFKVHSVESLGTPLGISPTVRETPSVLNAVTSPGLNLSYGTGRIALVTGAGRGIGRAIAETLAKTGMSHIVCVDLTKEGCNEVVSAINNMGGEASGYGCDVSDPQAVSSLCEALLSEHGHVDVLVNNAGITKDNLFMRMKEREWLDVINVNLNSVFYFTSPLVKRMIKNRFGRIINMASVVGVGGNAGQTNYAASKAAMIGFTRSLAKEVASRNVTVNAIAPGFIKTQMTDAMTEEARKATLAAIPAGRMGKVQEVADLAGYLASDNAGYLTGKVIPLDGAMLFGGN